MVYELRFSDIWAYLPAMLEGMLLTFYLSAVSMLLGFTCGVLTIVLRTVSPKVGATAVDCYVQVVRNTPFLVQIFLIYFGLPSIGIRLDVHTAAIVALTFNATAYISEILRSGVEGITRGQIDAGYSLGLKRMQVFLLVVFRPALVICYPALSSQFIHLVLATSVISVIAGEELTGVANNISSLTFKSFEVYAVVAAIYFTVTMTFSSIFWWIGRYLYRHRRAEEVKPT